MNSDTERMIAVNVFNTLTDRAGVAVAAQHDKWYCNRENDLKHPLHSTYKLACSCGWSCLLTDIQVMTTKSPVFRFALELHIDQIIAEFNPTLEELTNLGWFNED